ncbi:MAG: NUDIX domain-containing protein [Planctomycetaceae bacterium]
MSELKACGVLVVRAVKEDPRKLREFLLMKHPKRWDLPKGHVDPGEIDERVTALRELVEETGITADAIDLDPGFRFTLQYPVESKRTGGELWLKTVVIFLGRLKGKPDIRVTEHAGYRWFKWKPPHSIQRRTIDPLLEAVDAYLSNGHTSD